MAVCFETPISYTTISKVCFVGNEVFFLNGKTTSRQKSKNKQKLE